MRRAEKTKSSLVQNQNEGSITIDFFFALGVLGFSFCMTWMLVIYGTTLFSSKLIGQDSLSLMVHLSLSAAVVLTLLFVWRFSAFVFRIRPVLPFFSIMLSTANLWMEVFPFVEQDSPLLVLTWALTGIGFALLIVQWSEFASLLQVGQAKVFFASSMFTGVIWLGCLFITEYRYLIFLVYGAPLMSTFIVLFLRRYYMPFIEITFIERKISSSRMRLSWKPVLSTCVSSTALGFMLSWLLKHGNTVPYLAFALIAFMALSLMIMIIDAVRWKKLGENFVMKTFLLFVAVGMLPLLFISDEGKAVCCVIMLCGLIFSVVQGNSALNEHINLFHLAPMQTVAFGRLFSYLGVFLGFIFGYVAFWTTLFGEITLAVVTVFLILIFVVEAVFVMMENNYPIDEEKVLTSGIYSVSRPLTTGYDNETADLKGDRIDQEHPGMWRRKCEAVAAAYALSVRQKEVLLLLAKGRNAEYITQELVISLHTAKAHIYNIYQKMNVHSRQELIDLIEKVRIEL